MNIILIGPPASGKGTQAELLAKHFKLPIISIGKLYRIEIEKKTAIGKKAEAIVNTGGLAPNDLTNELLNSELKKKKYKSGLIFDGYPRNFQQAKFLENIIQIDCIIYLHVNQEEILKRLIGRRVCICGETFNIYSDKPKHNLICDKCGKKLIRRIDDSPSVIKERLKVYQDETKPIIQYFKKKKCFVKADGTNSIAQVFKNIIKSMPCKIQ